MVSRKGFMVGAMAAAVLAMGSAMAQASSLGFHDATFSFNGGHFGTLTGIEKISYGPTPGAVGYMTFSSNASALTPTGLGFSSSMLSSIHARIYSDLAMSNLVFAADANGATLYDFGTTAATVQFTGLNYTKGLSGPGDASLSLNLNPALSNSHSFVSGVGQTSGQFNAVPELGSTLGLAGMVLGGGLLGFRRRNR